MLTCLAAAFCNQRRIHTGRRPVRTSEASLLHSPDSSELFLSPVFLDDPGLHQAQIKQESQNQAIPYVQEGYSPQGIPGSAPMTPQQHFISTFPMTPASTGFANHRHHSSLQASPQDILALASSQTSPQGVRASHGLDHGRPASAGSPGVPNAYQYQDVSSGSNYTHGLSRAPLIYGDALYTSSETGQHGLGIKNEYGMPLGSAPTTAAITVNDGDARIVSGSYM